MHCDIKEPNIMLKTADYVKPEVVLIDFGVSKATTNASGVIGGTPGYMPPETVRTKKWFPRGDIFSMGVTIMQIMTDKIPPEGARTRYTPGGIFVEGCLSMEEIMQATQTREPPWELLPREMPGLNRLLRELLKKEMRFRPTAPQVLDNSWFASSSVTVEAVEAAPSTHKWATVGITQSFLMNFQDLNAHMEGQKSTVSESGRERRPSINGVQHSMSAPKVISDLPAPRVVSATSEYLPQPAACLRSQGVLKPVSVNRVRPRSAGGIIH